jgi:diketogulonate reductase-like aldo/keto reductase
MRFLTSYNEKPIPNVGLGTFPFQGRVMVDVVKEAVKIGYRLFDTADDYRGEPGLGVAIQELKKEGICTREDLFIQTKISDNNAHADEPLCGVYFNPNSKFMQRHSVEEIVREKVETSLHELGTSYIDSLLIHYPFPDYFVDIWKVMIDLKKEGVVRYIGVSNFHERHIENLINMTGVSPEINECYVSPIGIKQSIVDYCNSHNCFFMTYSPLMDLAANRIDTSKLSGLTRKYGKSDAQIILRWNIERGCMPLPKSKSPTRLAENFDVFDFSLTSDEVSLISSFNKDYQYLVESKICPGL